MPSTAYASQAAALTVLQVLVVLELVLELELVLVLVLVLVLLLLHAPHRRVPLRHVSPLVVVVDRARGRIDTGSPSQGQWRGRGVGADLGVDGARGGVGVGCVALPAVVRLLLLRQLLLRVLRVLRLALRWSGRQSEGGGPSRQLHGVAGSDLLFHCVGEEDLQNMEVLRAVLVLYEHDIV